MSIDDRPTIAAPDDDPYLWLEEIEGERALAFVEQQNALTLQKFSDAGFAGDRDALAAILDRPDNIPYIGRRGGFVYNLWKDANNPRGLWRRTTLAEFREAEPGMGHHPGPGQARRRGERGLAAGRGAGAAGKRRARS